MAICYAVSAPTGSTGEHPTLCYCQQQPQPHIPTTPAQHSVRYLRLETTVPWGTACRSEHGRWWPGETTLPAEKRGCSGEREMS